MSGFTEGDYQAVLRNLHRPKIDSDREDLELFLLDFYPYDESRLRRIYPEDDPNDDDNDEPQYDYDGKPIRKAYKKKSNNFRVRVFGTLERLESDPNQKDTQIKKYYSISVDLLNFEPFFFVKIPDHWRRRQLDEFIENLKHEARQDIEARYPYFSTLIKHTQIEAKPFYGFTADDQFQYVKLIFENSSGFNNYRNLIARLHRNSPAYWEKHQLFESNIEPMLRLNHIQEITPSGWIKIPKGQAQPSEKDTSDCQLHFEIDYQKIEPLPEKVDIPPMICTSFDIEADSSHGDFPIANKSYQKLAQDIVTQYLKLPNKNQHYLRAIIYRWITLAFHDYFDNNNINRIITKNGLKPSPDSVTYLANLVYELGEQYRSSLQDIIREGHDPAVFRDGILDRYVTQLHYHLEVNLPEMNLERATNGNYRLLAGQLLREVNRMVSCHKKLFLDEPLECIKFWINLAFDDYYDNHEINRVYTKDGVRPSPTTLRNLVPQIFAICQECYQELNKPKEKKKPVPKIGPKKCMTEPPEKGQTRLSQSGFMKRKMEKIAKLKEEKQKGEQQPQNDKETKNQPKTSPTQRNKESKISNSRSYDKNPHFQQQDQETFYRGRYIKSRPEPDPEDPEQKIPKIGRDFFVTWIYELLDQYLPDVVGDPIIQIGTTFKRYGEKELFLKHIITLKGCSKFTNAQLIDDENQDIFISKPKDAIAEAKKLKLETPLVNKIQDRLKEAEQKAIKNPKIPELEELNYLIYIARRDQQLGHDRSVVKVECYETEQEVLLAWRRLIKETDPDVLIGYNIFGFDFKYMWDRAEVLGVLEEFRDLGRIKLYPERLVEKKLVSSGLGDNLLYYIPMTGRILVDLLKVVQSGGYRLPIYKLDFVCNHFLYKRKNDLPPQKIFVYQKGSDQDRATIARYCLIDCILCNRLIDKLEILTNNIGMSRVCSVPLSYLFLRGQGIKIFSFLSKICRKENYLIKTKDRDDAKDQEGYEGAIVLEPEKGIYFEASVVADFNSLYPSCMIAWNLSHDSYIEIGGKYDNLPEDQYYDVVYDLYRMEEIPGRKALHKVKYGVKTSRYYQPPDGSKSLVPRVLESLLKARKQTRIEQKAFPKGSFEWNVKEGLQLAYKVTANSVYGQIGAPTSSVFLKDIAACTTACGRGLIYQSKNFFEDHYEGAKTIYGDSVTGDTPILVRDENGMIDIKTIETLNDEWVPYEEFKSEDITNRKEKQQSLVDLETWTKSGWSKIRRVIRHKTNQKIFRINTYNGCVDVTEDHSLLRSDGEIIKTIDCQTGTKLLHGFPNSIPQFKEIDYVLDNCDIWSNVSYQLKQYHKGYPPVIRCKTKLEAQKVFYIFRSVIGETVQVTYHPKTNKYLIFERTRGYPEHFNQIHQIIELPSSQNNFVYDLETDDGTFQAGIGTIIAKNTDSVFIKFSTTNIRGEKLHGLDSIYKSIELCMEGSLGISRTLPRPHNLEFEKAIWPFMLLSKKRYHGHYYTIYGKPKFYPNSMGIVLKRRDNAQIVKHIFGGVIDIIMEEHDIHKAMEYCQQESKKLLEGKFPMEYFTITKTLKSYYKNPDQIAHNVLAQRIAERDPGNKPQSNDRMAFAYIKVPEPKKGEKVLQGHRIETPEYIEDQELPLDYRFYLTNQVMKPLLQVFELVMDEKELNNLFTDALMEYDRKVSGIQRITKWVAPNSVEYQKRLNVVINDVLKKIHQEEESDQPVKIEAGDEVLF